MPFNQQMSFPCVLMLRTFPEGIRLCREPVKEIVNIHGKGHEWGNETLNRGDDPLSEVSGELFDIRGEIELTGASEFGFEIRGEAVRYDVKESEISCLGRSVQFVPVADRLKIQILVDRTSMEVFGNDGKVSMSFCFLPKNEDKSIGIYAHGGSVKIVSLKVYELRSIWH